MPPSFAVWRTRLQPSIQPSIPLRLDRYLRLGIPLLPIRNKIPVTKHGVYDASTDPKVISDWMAQFPSCDWAIPGGVQMEDGRFTVVIDRDTYKGLDTSDLKLPPTVSGYTPRGGGRDLYGSTRAIGSCDAVLGRVGFELKGIGKYCVVEGDGYGWEADPESTPIADLPDWLYQAEPVARPEIVASTDPLNTYLGACFDAMGWVGQHVNGKRYATCPWADQHTNDKGRGKDSSTVILPPTPTSTFGAFSCKHAHCTGRTSKEALDMVSPQARALGALKFPPIRKASEEPVKPPDPPTDDVKIYVPEKKLVGEYTKQGFKCAKVVANILSLCSQGPWAGCVAYDEMAEQATLMKRCPHEATASRAYPRLWNDNDDTLTAAWLQTSPYKLQVVSSLVLEGINAIAKEHRYNRLVEYLDSLVWDGTPRVDKWLYTYMGAEDSLYVSQAGAMWLISAIARAYRPGCQADYVLVLEGLQRIGKSSALRILGGEWFTDDIGDISTKDSPERLRGNWIIEVAEMAGLASRNNSVAKGFLTRRFDNYRESYGRRASKFARRCVFAPTTNDSVYLTDHTGGGRYWCVRAVLPDMTALSADRDQLWAEAVVRFRTGERWHPTTQEFKDAAAQEAERRRMKDPWEEVLDERLRGQPTTLGQSFDALGILTHQRDSGQQGRIARVLHVLGYRPEESGTWKRE